MYEDTIPLLTIPLLDFELILHYSHDRPNGLFSSFSNTTYQKIPGNFHLLSKMSHFQHHTQLYSKCNPLLISSLNLSPICWGKWSYFLLNAALPCHSWTYFPVSFLDVFSRVILAPFVITLHKQLKYFTFFNCFWSITICTRDCLKISLS